MNSEEEGARTLPDSGGSRPEGAGGSGNAPGGDDEEDPVMSMVRRQLERTNPPDTKALYGRAIRLDPSLRELSLRQFHAKYPLKVKREKAREEGDGS